MCDAVGRTALLNVAQRHPIRGNVWVREEFVEAGVADHPLSTTSCEVVNCGKATEEDGAVEVVSRRSDQDLSIRPLA